jgi:general secretion pathway protein G
MVAVCSRPWSSRPNGFTLIELLVVLTIVALMLTIAAPQFLPNVNRARETVLRQDLAIMRDAIDKYYSDKGVYPQKLEQLVLAKYLKQVPIDPVTDSADTWVGVAASEQDAGSGIKDIRSGATGVARDGSGFGSW